MIKHFHIVEKEASLFLKHICFYGSKVRWWNPDLISDDEKVDKATLDVANKDEDKDNEKAFQLTLSLHWLIQIGNHEAQPANSKQFKQAQDGNRLCQVRLESATCFSSCFDDLAEEKWSRRYKISPEAIFQIVPGNFLGRLNCLSICSINIS